jgi:hypothetical protein
LSPLFLTTAILVSTLILLWASSRSPCGGWYAWAWSPSPGHSLVIDERTHPRLEKYVKAVMGRFKKEVDSLYKYGHMN